MFQVVADAENGKIVSWDQSDVVLINGMQAKTNTLYVQADQYATLERVRMQNVNVLAEPQFDGLPELTPTQYVERMAEMELDRIGGQWQYRQKRLEYELFQKSYVLVTEDRRVAVETLEVTPDMQAPVIPETTLSYTSVLWTIGTSPARAVVYDRRAHIEELISEAMTKVGLYPTRVSWRRTPKEYELIITGHGSPLVQIVTSLGTVNINIPKVSSLNTSAVGSLENVTTMHADTQIAVQRTVDQWRAFFGGTAMDALNNRTVKKLMTEVEFGHQMIQPYAKFKAAYDLQSERLTALVDIITRAMNGEEVDVKDVEEACGWG